jgi:hypothetical protein
MRLNRDITLEADVLVCGALAEDIGSSLVQKPLHPLIHSISILLDQDKLLQENHGCLFPIGIASGLGRKDVSAF